MGKVAIVLTLALGALLIAPLRYALLGLAKHERFYQRRPTSYWLKLLKDEEPRYRRWAARNLGDLGPESGVVPALSEALGDKDFYVHRNAVLSLRTLGPAAQEAVAPLRAALQRGDIEDRELIEEALTKIAPESVPKVGAETEP